MAKDSDLVAERMKYLLAMDRAYPDVGMGLVPFLAHRQAIEQLKAEGKIKRSYAGGDNEED